MPGNADRDDERGDFDDGMMRATTGHRKSTTELESDIMNKYLNGQKSKKEAAELRRKEKVLADKAAKGVASVAKKESKPVKADPSKKSHKRGGVAPVRKRPAAAVKVWEKASKPPCPGASDGPLDYKRARIYQSTSKSMFRVICDRTNYSTEKAIRWNKGKPTPSTWKKAIAVVDEYKKK